MFVDDVRLEDVDVDVRCPFSLSLEWFFQLCAYFFNSLLTSTYACNSYRLLQIVTDIQVTKSSYNSSSTSASVTGSEEE